MIRVRAINVILPALLLVILPAQVCPKGSPGSQCAMYCRPAVTRSFLFQRGDNVSHCATLAHKFPSVIEASKYNGALPGGLIKSILGPAGTNACAGRTAFVGGYESRSFLESIIKHERANVNLSFVAARIFGCFPCSEIFMRLRQARAFVLDVREFTIIVTQP